VSHPLLESRETTDRAMLLVLSANRGFCGGFNSNVIRAGVARWRELTAEVPNCRLEISGKRGINGFVGRGIKPDERFTHFDDRPAFAEVELLANRYLESFILGDLDRLDVVYTRFESASRQQVTIETLLPLGALGGIEGDEEETTRAESRYEFLPSPESILEEVVPTSFKVRLFKCFLDSAVSEQIARMVAMKSATENAGELIRQLSMAYNRARQGRITSELMDVIGGVEAIS
jgi:F-type H+-transporting ATPase subunit gamma